MKKFLIVALLLFLFGEIGDKACRVFFENLIFTEAAAQGLSAANLAIDNSIISGPATVGSNMTYFVAVHNHGPADATGITVTDVLPTFTDFVSASPGCTNIDGIVTCELGSLGLHGTTNAIIILKPTAAGMLCSYASTVSSETDTSLVDNTVSACTTVGPPTVGVDLAVSLSDTPGVSTEGNDLSYTLRVQNNGPNTATGVVLTDVLPENVTFVSASPACTNNGGIVTCNIPSIVRGRSVTETIVVTATATGQVCNTATVAAAQSDPLSDNNTGTACTDVASAPQTVDDLAVVKITAPAIVRLSAKVPSRTVQVQVQIQNRSPHAETIASLDGLVDLSVGSLGVCNNLTATLHVGKPQKVPPTMTLLPKKTLIVYFDVTFTTNCVNAPAFGTSFNPGHGDYRYSATVHHESLPGGAPDTHSEDDVCPRSVTPPYDTEPNPDGTIKDKGCGSKKADGTFGGDVITDIWLQ